MEQIPEPRRGRFSREPVPPNEDDTLQYDTFEDQGLDPTVVRAYMAEIATGHRRRGRDSSLVTAIRREM
jgi:hypothetical protein